MATYYAIPDATIAAGKPVTTALLVKYRNNPIALYENTAVGALTTVGYEANTTTWVDVTEFNVSALAGTVWHMHYHLSYAWQYTGVSPAVTMAPWVSKVYAASLNAAPGYAVMSYNDLVAAATSDFHMSYAAVAAELSTTAPPSGVYAGSLLPGLMIDARVYVGSADTTIKLAIKANNNGWTAGTKVGANSIMLAREISGTV